MPAIVDNPHVALNNARNLPRKGATSVKEQGSHAASSHAALNSDQKKRLAAYIKARRTRAECDEFIAENKSDVFDILGKLPGGNFTQSNSMIYRADAISYEYPPEIEDEEAILSSHKAIAKLDGRAKKIVKGCVKFEALD